MSEPSQLPVVERAAMVVIGDELLSGKIAEQNVMPLARALLALGIRLSRVVVIPDDVRVIAEEVRRLSDQADIVFTSGGIGPTHDDVSVEGVARALGADVVESPELVGLLESVYGARFSALHRRMARVPRGSTLLMSKDVRWPAIVCGKVWMLPGVPELFRMRVGVLREHMRGPRPIYGAEVLSRAEEADITGQIDVVVARYPDVQVGSYPKWADPAYKTRVTFDGIDEGRVTQAASDFRELIIESAIDPLR